MVNWSKMWGQADRRVRHGLDEETRSLLPNSSQDLPATMLSPHEVTKVALRLRYQIEQVIPCEIEEARITQANSPVITPHVIRTAKEAGGQEYKACVVYGLLVCKRWFLKQADLELWDSTLLEVRSMACEIIAKRIIEEEDDEDFLLLKVLLKRFSVVQFGRVTAPANVIERASDLHALSVIGSSGYQKCIKYVRKGWIVPDGSNQETGEFVNWKERDNPDYWAHFDPSRMRIPMYQNIVHIGFSLIYLLLYTIAVNTVNADGDVDIVEGILYVMTFGYICDEISKLWKVGGSYFGFWNAFHVVLYAILTISFVIRMVALGTSSDEHNERRRELNTLGYYFFATAAPMFWSRLLLNLDSFRFFGTMLVVLKVMMRESLIFFALLALISIGFLQSFIGFDQAGENGYTPIFVIQAMVDAVMQSPNFEGFEGDSFGLTLYYIFTFVVMVILLNILVALYNTAYADITDNAIDEYMALFSQRTMTYVRAPDENVFLAPFNLIEIFFLVLPFEWWLSDSQYKRLNHYVMGFLYSPLLLISSWYEVKEAKVIRRNRQLGEADDDTVEAWEQPDSTTEDRSQEWSKWVQKVKETKPDIQTDTVVLEIRELKKQVDDLMKIVQRLSPKPEEKQIET